MVGLMLLTGSENGETNVGNTSKFALDHDVNAKLYLWRGTPWALEVDAVVNSSNEVCCFHSASFNTLDAAIRNQPKLVTSSLCIDNNTGLPL